ncbi:homeobox protein LUMINIDEPENDENS-like isoform X2 [Dioscorea cayenensis subsp. rotundata]|uniref:Homeobox protein LUMINIDEPENDENS-like isoform X2 n=1 Tax=Dioscorea cayennensis subsp. rotundata TaxID=55577 RepID=A0AB40BMJ7_DIOCR|nr:homeobox protein LUMINIDEPENDENS-like isoform X2 [Dioscorea cayenensis subsp. rotundata]
MLGSEMAIVPAISADGSFAELEGVGDSVESFVRLLETQKELFHIQIDQLQKLVVTQCKLTGANPLSQEMAAGALSIKIGKKPRDLLNPKAVKYMQSIFSIKDAIGKKETREISALCGITVTQVREFFAGQRSRVRKLTRVSREKVTQSEASKEPLDVCPISVEQPLPVAIEAPASLNTVNPMTVQHCQVLENYGNANATEGGQQVPVNSTEVKTAQEGASCLPQEEAIDGQAKLMEWVLQIQNIAVLNWFLTKGGIPILASWLSEAALEEQSSLLLVLLKVLCHLPLHKVLPLQMSGILQTINKLRFYNRSSDISNRARILLSRLSKIFIRNQAMKKPTFSKLPRDVDKEIIRKQRISEILLSDESWQSKIDIPEEILALTENNDMSRRTEPRPGLKLLTSSADESNKRHSQSVSTSKNKQRRKVQLVDQPDSKAAGRSVQVARAGPSNQSRPMSADDIQKAKMRAMFMQNKYGKSDVSTPENLGQKSVNREISSAQIIKTTPSSRIAQLPHTKRNEDKKPLIPIRKPSPVKMETDSKPNKTSREHLLERLKSVRTQWHSPPEVKINSLWRVGAGENSKEVEVQTARTCREKETLYANQQEVPPNPKEPWDTEMDFDDSLTTEIPIEQPPEVDIPESSSSSLPNGIIQASKVEVPPTATSLAPAINNAPPEADMELLAVLLKNPELVFALTSGQTSNMTSHQTVALLDMLKKSGVGFAQSSREIQEPTSLPSPTPPSESRSEWRSEPSPFTRNPPQLLQPPHVPAVVLTMPQLTVTTNLNPTTTPQNHTLMNHQAYKQLPAATMYAQQSSNTSAYHSSLAQMHNASTSLLNSTMPTWLPSSVAPSTHFDANQYNHRMYSASQGQMNAVRNNAELYSNRGLPDSRREHGPSYRPEWPANWNPGEHRDWQNRPSDAGRRGRDRDWR